MSLFGFGTLSVWLSAMIVASAQADVRYVDDSAPDGGDGLSWATAFDNLQDALDLAANPRNNIEEIRLGQGAYVPTKRTETDDPRSATFQLLPGLALKGGYAGFGAADPEERNIASFATSLTGDLSADDGPPGSFTNYTENAYHVLTASGADSTAVLDGVTVTAGSACCGFEQFDPRSWGGGVHSVNGSPTLIQCTFTLNQGGRGGGAYFQGGSPDFVQCTWIGNRVNNTNQRGGAIYLDNADSTYAGCTFTQNLATRGGAIYCRNANGTVADCTFSQNLAVGGNTNDGGAIFCLALNGDTRPTTGTRRPWTAAVPQLPRALG
jgi:predicted outer membrane repeat protein